MFFMLGTVKNCTQNWIYESWFAFFWKLIPPFVTQKAWIISKKLICQNSFITKFKYVHLRDDSDFCEKLISNILYKIQRIISQKFSLKRSLKVNSNTNFLEMIRTFVKNWFPTFLQKFANHLSKLYTELKVKNSI